ncbi:MAG: CAP domain-containing protein [Verrucomicrobiales bacterium]|nr:CAP domain-containing protein [Verrucomicrobiales bacterium]
MKSILLASFVSLLFSSMVSAQQGAGVTGTDAQQLLQLVNQARAQNGAGPLTYNGKLNNAAQGHSADMAARNYFSHNARQPAPRGVGMGERATAAGYDWSAIAENIANGQTTVQAVFTSWMNSEGHRGNILNPVYTEMGIGRVGNLWTQMFGKGW